MMATILPFSLAGRRIRHDRPKPGATAAIVPYPGVRYERLDGKPDDKSAREAEMATLTSGNKARVKPDF